MGYRNILVHVDESTACANRVHFAAGTARLWGATLTGIFLKSDFLRSYFAAETISYLPPAEVDKMIADYDGAAQRASEAARQRFEEAAQAAHAPSDWIVIDGDTDRALISNARRSDLLIVAPRVRVGLDKRVIPASALGIASGAPLLVVPETAPFTCVMKRVLVAWKDAREASRALRDALPYLRTAQTVQVLIVSPDAAGPDSALQQHLERNGCKAEIIIDRSTDAIAGEIVRRQAQALQADLVVMGLYGRSRLEEMVLGGVAARCCLTRRPRS